MKRNYGIDALRIYAMFTIILIHITGHGGVVVSVLGSLTPNTFVVQFIASVIAPAVNTFVLISGFVGYRGEKVFPNYKNIISLWAQVCFYSVLVTVVFKVLYPGQVSLGELALSTFPVMTDAYWFFSVYFLLNIISPMVNLFVARAEKKALFYALAVLVLFVSCFETLSLFFGDSFGMAGGYGIAWLTTVYLLGAVIKKYDLHQKIGTGKGVMLFSVCVLLMWLMKVGFGALDFSILRVEASDFYYFSSVMPSPLNLFAAVGLFCIFANMKVGSIPAKIISFISPNVFAVYLIHDHNLFRSFIITNSFSDLAKCRLDFLLLYVFGTAFVIFVGSIAIDKVRALLFKLFRIDRLSVFAAEKIKGLFFKIYNKLDN